RRVRRYGTKVFSTHSADQSAWLACVTTGGRAMTESIASRTEEVFVRMSVADGIATVILDSAQNRNALSARLRDELNAALDDAIADEQVRVIVLTHAGPVFCAGADLKEVANPGRSGVT